MSFVFKASTALELHNYTQEEFDLINSITHELNAELKAKTRNDPTWICAEIKIKQSVTNKIAKTICFIFSQAGWERVSAEIEEGSIIKFYIRNSLSLDKDG